MRMIVEIKEHFSISDPAKWDSYVESDELGSLSQNSKFLEILVNVFGYKARYIWAEHEGEVVGVLPLMEVPGLLSSNVRLISVPVSAYSGAIGKSPEIVRSLVECAAEITKEPKKEYLEIRQLRRIDRDVITKESYVTFLYNLEAGKENFWENLNRKTRGSIRKAEKRGLICEVDSSNLEIFYKFYVKRLKELGSPAYPYTFFTELCSAFGDDVKISLVKKEERVIAACFSVIYNETIYAMLAGADSRYRSLNPYSLMYWKIIEYSCSHRVKRFDFGRSRIGTGSFDFKKNWGLPATQLYYQYILGTAKNYPTLESGSIWTRAFQFSWRLLPMPIARWIGPKIRKYIVA